MSFIVKLAFSLFIPAMIFIISIQKAQAATSASTEFKATIVGGSCDISAPATVPINKGVVIPSEDIIGGNSPVEVFELTLSNCKGYGLTPVITLEGDVDSTSGIPLFLANTSSTKGFGILVTFDGNSNFKENKNLAKDKKITASNKAWSTTIASVLNGTIPLNASVSCGNCATEAEIQGGELKANITFNFSYN
ncbi:fimbrial-like protein [Morganella morganii]|uniref:fimbrial protein n=1 Tax=Morganella morganii TaxID=582 RepID=UPI0031AB17DB